MATQAQRDWSAIHRAAAAAQPEQYEAVRIKSSVDRAKEKTEKATEAAASVGREYRGPTPEQVAAGTLEVGTPTTAHRTQARAVSLLQPAIKTGEIPQELVALKVHEKTLGLMEKALSPEVHPIISGVYRGSRAGWEKYQTQFGAYETEYKDYSKEYERMMGIYEARQIAAEGLKRGEIGGVQAITHAPVYKPDEVSLPASIHATQPTILIHGRTPTDYGEDIQVYRDPSFKEIEAAVSQKIPTFGSLVGRSVEFAEEHPKISETLIGVREAMYGTPRGELTSEIVSAFGEGVYTHVQEKPVQTAAFAAAAYVATPLIGVVAPAVRFLPHGAQAARAASTVGKIPYFGYVARKLPEATMLGLFGAIEYKRATQPVFSGVYTDEGMPIMRKPTYPEMAGRLGETAVIAEAMLAGAGLYKYGGVGVGKIKDIFKGKPKTAEEIAVESERLYTVAKGYKVTEKTQPYSFVGDATKRRVQIITEEIPESAISAAQIRKYEEVVKYQEARDLLTRSQFTKTTAAGEIKTVEQIGKTTLIKKSPEPEDIVAGIQQITLRDISVGRVGTGQIRAQYGGVSKDVFRRGSTDWDVVITEPDKFTQWTRMKGIADAPFTTPTELKHVRGSVLGPLDDIKPTESIFSTIKVRISDVQPIRYDKYGKVIKPQYDILEGRPLASRTYDVPVKQTGVDEFFRESVSQIPLTKWERIFGHGRKDATVSLYGRTLEAVESAKPVITPKPRDIDKSMKGFMVKHDESLLGSVGKESKGATTSRTGQSQTVGLIEDTATKTKSKGVVAEQILGVTEPKIVEGTQAAIISPKIIPRPIQRTGALLIAPSFKEFVGSIGASQVQELEPITTLKPLTTQAQRQESTPFSIFGQMRAPIETIKPIQKQRPRLTIKPLLATDQIIGTIAALDIKTKPPKPVREVLKPKAPLKLVIPIIPPFKLPKKDKKADKKTRKFSLEGFEWFIENPIASPFGISSVGKIKQK